MKHAILIFLNEIIQYDITKEELAWFKKYIWPIIQIIDKICYPMTINLDYDIYRLHEHCRLHYIKSELKCKVSNHMKIQHVPCVSLTVTWEILQIEMDTGLEKVLISP